MISHFRRGFPTGMSAGRAGSARRADRRDATGGAEAAGEPARTGRRPVACVSRRRRPRVAERHGDRRPGALRHRPPAGGLSGLRGRRQAGRHVLHPHEPADRARAADRHEREHGITAADRAGGGDRLRPPAAAAGSGRDRRLRQPRRHPAAVHEQRPRARAGDPADVGRRLDVDVQRDLHRAEGPEEDRRHERRRNPATGDRRPVGRRGHVEPAAVRGGPRSREALRDGDLRDRAAVRSTGRRRAAGASRKPSSSSGSSRRRPAAGRSSRPSSPISRASTARSPTSCRASTPSATRRATRRRDGAWRRIVVRVNRPNLTARTKQGYFAPTAQT